MKKIIIRVLISIGILILTAFILYKATEEKSVSNDSLHGSFSIENGNLGKETEPTDFLVSINYETSHEKIVDCAKKNKVDISRGCWVYCFAENKVFKGKKTKNKIKIFEDNKEIGYISYKGKNFYVYDGRKYNLHWRNSDFILHKDSQSFLFPSN